MAGTTYDAATTYDTATTSYVSQPSISGYSKTPADLHELERQKEKLQYLRSVASPSVQHKATDKLIKSTEITMQQKLLWSDHAQRLDAENKQKK